MPDPILPLPGAEPYESTTREGGHPEPTQAGLLMAAGGSHPIAWLPHDVLLHIGRFLPDRSLLDFARSCRANWRSMRPEASWRRTLALVDRTRNLAQIHEALQAATACPARQQSEAVSKLAKRLPRVPSYQACDAVRVLLARSALLPPTDQARIRIKLMHGLREAMATFTLVLDEDDQALESTAAELEESTGALLASLPVAQQAALLPRFLPLAKAVPPEQRSVPYWLGRVSAFGAAAAARTLAAATRWLIPHDDIGPAKMAITELLQAALALRDKRGQAVPELSALLYELIQNLCDIRGHFDRYPLWRALLDATLQSPADRRAVPFCELALILSVCSDGRASRMQSGWQTICDAVETLPEPHRMPVIGALTSALGGAPWIVTTPLEQPVPDAVVAQNCHRVLDLADALDEAARLSVRITMLNMLRVRYGSVTAIPTVTAAFESVLRRVVSPGPNA